MPEVLASVQITSPHGQRAVSLQERQAEMLREKIKGAGAPHHGHGAQQQRQHRHRHQGAPVDQRLAARERPVRPARGGGRAASAPCSTCPGGRAGVWTVAAPYIDADFTQGASEDARAFASSLTMPFCGPNLGFEPAGWLAQEAGEPAQSLALLPLREGADRQRHASVWPAGAGLARPAALSTPPWARNSSRALRSWPARRWCG